MTRLLLAAALLVGAPAFGQSVVTLDLDLTTPGSPSIVWSSSAGATGCSASGDWSGIKATTGNESIPRITSTNEYSLTCAWQGDSMATLTWENPTEYEDGSTYDHNDGTTRLVYADTDTSGVDCYDPMLSGASFVDRPGENTVHTITALPPGEWFFGAFAIDPMGLCSTISNVVAKTLTTAVTATATIRISVPAPPTNLTSD